jgi:tRNA(Ile)-lysidine synthase
VLQRVAEVITRYNMLARGARVGVAVSGGADSVCLLHVLTKLARDWNLGLTVLHADHGLRGEESRTDARFVSELAAQLGWPRVIRELRLESGENLEQAAREARLDFFRAAALDAGLDCVATGHTHDDQAETVLFRLLRGSGTAGLAGVRPVMRSAALKLVRPLIETSRAEIECWLGASGLGWREDSTNVTEQFARNRIRRELLPQLEREWNPAIRETLAQTADWAQAEEAYWEAETSRLARACLTEEGGFVLLDVRVLGALPLAAARRVTRRAIETVKGDLRGIDFGHVEAILAVAAATEGHGRVQIPGLDIFRSFEWLRFGPVWADSLEDRNYSAIATVPATPRDATQATGPGVRISLELLEKPPDLLFVTDVYNSGMGWLDRDCLSSSLILRNWRPGDQYQPVGRSRAEKIKTMFQEFRIPLWERRHWPVLMDGEQIVWARRFGAAVSFAATAGSRRVLQIRESGRERTASIGVGPVAEVS